jgi:hypothetical protein
MTIEDDKPRSATTPSSRWSCTRCGSAFDGTPPEATVDIHDRWRLGHCRVCRRKSVMQRQGPPIVASP